MEKKSHNMKYEDTIQCSFFCNLQTAKELEDRCEAINEIIGNLSKDYIWQRDEFKVCLSIVDTHKSEVPAHITSTTCFGDNIEDEWFIVYLVKQITCQYKDLVVQVEDNDGSFLLIEAADCLPSWANPESTDNRVFIFQGQIHLIPPEVFEIESKISLKHAIKLVTEKSEHTVAATEIQDAVLKRINCYPEKLKECHHRALVNLPLHLAAVLSLKPSLLSPIVTAYCNHDMIDANCFKKIEFENCVTIPVLFTKYLYAMLLHSNLPKINRYSSNLQNNKETALGWKLSCGYEIIMNKSSKDPFNSTEYNRFISNLKTNGYFKDNIEGSKQYNELLEKARAYFSNTECPLTSYYCHCIKELKNTDEFLALKDGLQNKEKSDLCEVDTEEWLNINPDELNTFLNTHYGKKIFKNHDLSNPEITSELTNFLSQTSDFEGVEYVREEELDENKIEFDSEEFITSIQKMLKLVTNENDNSHDYFSNSDDEENSDILIENDLDKELAFKLKKPDIDNTTDENIVRNLLQSIKEEGTSGPSSTILKSIGVNKTEMLDSDDE